MTTHASGRASTVAIAGGKGGCGKTTTALGLALALVRRGRRPLVVDADVDVPDLHIRAGVDREPGLPELTSGERPIRVAQSSPEFPGIDVLAAGAAGPSVDVALGYLVDLDRPVIVDCPAGAGPDAAAPLRTADATLLVTTAAPESRQDAAKTARMAEALGAPPVATVERTSPDRSASRDDGAVALGEDARVRHRPADPPVLAVPRVPDPPLSSPRLLDRYHVVSRNVFGE